MPAYECVIEEVTYRNDDNGYSVLRLQIGRQRATAVGTIPFAGAGETVRVTGEWVEHPEYGRQLKVSLCESLKPTSRSGVEKYLASGLVKGVGPSTAKLLVQHFGEQALDVISGQPERLTEVDGIGPKRARMIAESLASQLGMRSAMLFLQSHDISPSLAMKIFKRYGERTQELLRLNPYRLADDIPGVGFQTADAIAASVGIAKDSPARIECGVKYVLTDAAARDQHMYLPREDLIASAARLLDSPRESVEHALEVLLLAGALKASPMEEIDGIYIRNYYEAEVEVAKRLADIARGARAEIAGLEARVDEYERDAGVSLCGEQREAVLEAASGGLTVITGGPGTGKTTSIRAIIELLSRSGEVLLTAPTGRAAKRMSEATGCPARTIHRLLEFSGDEGSFARNADNPLDAAVIIVDEMSMVDIFLMRGLLAAVKRGTRLVLVGDADQLPSVGPGNVLRDIIASGALNVVRLTEIFRQAGESMIVSNAHRINRGLAPIVNGKGSDFFLERKESIKDVAEAIVELSARRLPAYLGADSMRDIQVLSPMKKGDVGVYALNSLLQARLNPPRAGALERARGNTLFRVGDKVMQTKNNYQLEWRRESERGSGVFNGDMGFITAIDQEESTVEVTFDDDRLAEYDDSSLEELELAYCISVHKSQGSEFPAVIMPAWSGPAPLMTRNLLYTAVTRARRLVVLVGREAVAAQMALNNHIYSRYSALDRRLREELS